MKYYYTDSQNQVKGPVEQAELQALLSSGSIPADANAVPEGGQDWVPARTIAHQPAAALGHPKRFA